MQRSLGPGVTPGMDAHVAPLGVTQYLNVAPPLTCSGALAGHVPFTVAGVGATAVVVKHMLSAGLSFFSLSAAV